MKWIDTTALDRWADSIPAETKLPDLIADLIRASAPQITDFRFPGGNSGRSPGFDGWLHTKLTGHPFIPNGRSIWEWGRTAKYQEKANEDYLDRTSQVSPSDRQSITFIFVTPRTWKNPNLKIQDWINEKKSANEWADVRVIDGVGLERWLESAPAVAAHYARYELETTPRYGASSVDEFWHEYASRFKPSITEDVLLCDRTTQADELVSKLAGNPIDINIAADSSDEVIAFAIAAIRRSAHSEYLKARTIVVDTEEAARLLQHKQGLIFLPRGQARHHAGVLARSGPTVVSHGSERANRNIETLHRPSASNLGKAIETMSFPFDKAYQLARECGRTLTILERRLRHGASREPEWMKAGRDLMPAMLAGGWDSLVERDTKVLCSLANDIKYDELEGRFTPLMAISDPPLDREKSVWKIRSPVDAFVHLARLITTGDLDRLRQAATEVFSEIEYHPNEDELFEAKKLPFPHSSGLRDGLATTLLLLANLSDEAGVTFPQGTAQGYVNDLIRALPGLKDNSRLLASLSKQLPMLAEAAPDPLFEALDTLFEGTTNNFGDIFAERKAFFSTDCSLPGLLWALERLAWDPELLLRSTLALAKLARIDPGGTLGNRPIKSLRSILLSWSPNTNATLTERLAAVDNVTRCVPEIAWQLIIELLPKGMDSSSTNSKPQFREARQSEKEPLTYARVWASMEAIVTRAIKLAGDDIERLSIIVREIGNYRPSSRVEVINRYAGAIEAASGEQRKQLWGALNEVVNRHKAFGRTDWALKGDDLAPLEDLAKRYAPGLPSEQLRWLFDDWNPDIPDKRDGGLVAIEAARRDAVTRILDEEGLSSVIELSQSVKVPGSIAEAYVGVRPRLEDTIAPIELLHRQSVFATPFTRALSGFGAAMFAGDFRDWFAKQATQYAIPETAIVEYLNAWPDERETWQFAEILGASVSRKYWNEKWHYGLKSSGEDLIYAISMYRKVGRPLAAIGAIYFKTKEVNTETLFTLLDEAIVEINQADERQIRDVRHNIAEIFKELRSRSDDCNADIAKREYAYLPLLDEEGTLSLHILMADDPSFYASLIGDAFKPVSAEKTEVDESGKTRAKKAYRLLQSMKQLPGEQSGAVDIRKLRAWVKGVQRACADNDRARIGEQYIGHVLAHSPADSVDGGWPTRETRAVLEELASSEVISGILIERSNMRGIVSKAIGEGGKQERELASQYLSWAMLAASWPKTATMLKTMSERWKSDAEHEDSRARKRAMEE